MKFSVLKKSFLVFVLLSVLVSSSEAALNLNFSLTNKSGKTIYRMYMSPSENGKWDFDVDEISGSGFPIMSGEKINITMGNNESRQRIRLWDMRVYFRDRVYWEFHNIDLSRVSNITLNVDGRAVDNLGKYYRR